MTTTRNSFVIAGRINRILRLNDVIYPSHAEAKAALDAWEKNDDPRREQHERNEEFRRRANRRYWDMPKDHNRREFEVIDLESHINHVANISFERGKHPITKQAPNTTKQHSV